MLTFKYKKNKLTENKEQREIVNYTLTRSAIHEQQKNDYKKGLNEAVGRAGVVKVEGGARPQAKRRLWGGKV